jgi:hypothetical protein
MAIWYIIFRFGISYQEKSGNLDCRPDLLVVLLKLSRLGGSVSESNSDSNEGWLNTSLSPETQLMHLGPSFSNSIEKALPMLNVMI